MLSETSRRVIVSDQKVRGTSTILWLVVSVCVQVDQQFDCSLVPSELVSKLLLHEL